MSVSVALLGAGIFGREEYVPALQRSDGAVLKAVYSRTRESAEKLAAEISSSVDVYYDVPREPGRHLDDLLSRSDVKAIIVAVPILAQPPIIKKAFAAGKHVLSEKPIAANVAAAQDLLEAHQKVNSNLIWMVAENFRFIDPLVAGHAMLAAIGGDLVSFRTNVFNLIGDDDKFYRTPWRQTPEYQGGFLLDGGVHFIAGLRYLLSAVGEDIASLSAQTALVQPKLAPLDTLHSVISAKSGRAGTFCVSFGSAYQSVFEIAVTTTNGSVSMGPTSVTLRTSDSSDGVKEEVKEFAFGSGVASEINAFIKAVQTGTLDPRGAAEEALKDLMAIEKMLESGKNSGSLISLPPCVTNSEDYLD